MLCAFIPLYLCVTIDLIWRCRHLSHKISRKVAKTLKKNALRLCTFVSLRGNRFDLGMPAFPSPTYLPKQINLIPFKLPIITYQRQLFYMRLSNQQNNTLADSRFGSLYHQTNVWVSSNSFITCIFPKPKRIRQRLVKIIAYPSCAGI